MGEDDKALVETVRLEAEINKNYDGIAYKLLTRIADRIEDLSAENERLQRSAEYWEQDAKRYADNVDYWKAESERLREALTQIARLRTDLRGDFSLGSKQSDIARAALGETK